MVKIFEWFENIFSGIVNGITDNIHMQAVKFFKQEIAMSSIDPKMVKDPDLRKKLEELKKGWKNSPNSISDIGNDIIKILTGRVAQVQLEAIAGIKIDSKDVVTNRLFTQIQILTDVTLIANMFEVVGACVPTCNLQVAGSQIRQYLDYSGLTQATGFGYGMILSNVVSPLLTQELNQKIRPVILDPAETVRLGYREILTPEQRDTMLSKLGLSDTLQSALIKGYEYYPMPQDFIRFAVRDTFNPTVVSKYQYDMDYPTSIDPFLKKAGMTKEWMQHFWRAHWELPSTNQTFEMLHRGKITTDDARNLLRIADVAPYFVQPLLDVAYNPYTRVDIRRMYAEGVLTKDEVLRSYKDIGYDDAHAQKLTDWTTKDGLSRERDLTLSQTIDAYTEGEILSSKALEDLKKLGYDDEESKLVLKLEDNKIERAFRKREKNILVKKFVKNQMTLVEFSRLLDGLKISDREKKITIEEARLQLKEII